MTTCSILIRNALVVTVDAERRVVPRGYVAIADDRIVGIGADVDCDFDADEVIDARGGAVIPGFVNAHTHSVDLLLRGGLCDDRRLYDWLVNVVDPGCGAYEMADVSTAVEVYALEAIRSGITTVVDSIEMPIATWDTTAEVVLGVYRAAGMRTVYSMMFYDHAPDAVRELMNAFDQRPAERRAPFGAMMDLDEALAGIERVMKAHHGSDDGRIMVWPSPGVAILCSDRALLEAQALARRYGARTTVHVCESPVDARQCGLSGVQYLHQIGYLAPDVLAAHCVQIDTSDIRLLATTDTKVATNPVSNMFLGNGIARVGEMLGAGITVGIGTDDANCNGTVNMLADLKFAALSQKALYRDPGVVTAEKVIEMATIDGARAIGLEDSIGSLEIGKKADLSIVDLDRLHLTPRHSVASVLVYQALGNEIRTVVIDGRIVLRDRQPTWITPDQEAELIARAQATSERVVVAAGLPERSDDRWRSRY